MNLKVLGLLAVGCGVLSGLFAGGMLQALGLPVFLCGIFLLVYGLAGGKLEKLAGSMGVRAAAVAFALLLVFFAGCYRLGGKSMWADEVIVYFDSQEGARFMLRSLSPLHLGLIRIASFAGTDEVAMRFPSVVFGVVAALFTYKLAVMLYGWREGLLSLLMLATSSLYLHYMQEARLYMLMVMLSMASLYFLYRALHDGRNIFWLGFAVSNVLNFYTSYAAAAVLLPELAYAILFYRKNRDVLAKCMAGTAAIAVLSLPGVYYALKFMKNRVAASMQETVVSILTPETLVSSFGGSYLYEGVSYAPILTFLLLALFFYGLVKSNARERGLLALYTILPVVSGFFLTSTINMQPRYLLFVFPVYIIAVSKGLLSLSSGDARIMAVAGILILGALNTIAYYDVEKIDWRSTASYLKSNMQPEDKAVAIPGFVEDTLRYYGMDPKTVIALDDWAKRPVGRQWFVYNAHTRDPDGGIRRQLDENCALKARYAEISIYLCEK
ncbi:MAG: glycosyltransferase family 39 protein [Candidatus Altiarchaeota archaeon]|nr:glycosyltransferase family 39 protein [Candidatus Altiarchaeota archaeon]